MCHKLQANNLIRTMASSSTKLVTLQGSSIGTIKKRLRQGKAILDKGNIQMQRQRH
jgi:hypothetical protein